MEKRPFFRADMAGLGKYCMGGYGQIGVYRVNDLNNELKLVRTDLMMCQLTSRLSPNKKADDLYFFTFLGAR